MDARQEAIDHFYWKHGPCCAGCDYWRHQNSVAGECMKSAPVPGKDRAAVLRIESCSAFDGAGHVLTPREHVCGDFRDGFDWSSLPPAYRKRIGAPTAPAPA